MATVAVAVEVVLLACGVIPTGASGQSAAGVVATERVRENGRGGLAVPVRFDDAPHPVHGWWIVAARNDGGPSIVYNRLPATDPEHHVVSWLAAAQLAGATGGVPAWAAVGDNGIEGRSSDAAVALAMLDATEPGGLTGGFDVAVSGALTGTTLTSVTQLEAKASAANLAGVDVLFVPVDATGVHIDVVGDEAAASYATLGAWSAERVASGPMLVVAVRDLADVIAFLCGAGAPASCAAFER